MFFSESVIFILIFFVIVEGSNTLPPCTESEITYFQGPCSQDGSQWIFKLPKDPKQCNLTNNQAIFLDDCKKTCGPGEFRDFLANRCVPCRKGTASAGDVYEIDSWTTLPSGFYSDSLGSLGQDSRCASFGWIPKESYLEGSSSPDCASELTMENTNIKSGEVSFEYKFTDTLSLAYFTIRNKRCVLDKGKSHILLRTSKDQWKTFSLPIEEGSSTFQWYLFSDDIYGLNHGVSTFVIKSIRVTGRVPDIGCPECKPGFFSDQEGSSQCKLCLANQKSDRGAENCVDCDEADYAPAKSAKCFPRQPCKQSEYVGIYGQCSPNDQTQLEYSAIEPIVCLGGVAKPANGAPEQCLTCPPGSIVRNATHCVSCPPGQISNKGTCTDCLADQAPVLALNYTTWHRFPDFMHTTCLGSEDKCTPWKPNGTAIFCGPGLMNLIESTLILNISKGFLTPETKGRQPRFHYAYPLPGTKMVVDFEIICKGQCSLSLRMENEFDSELVKTWTGETKRQRFAYTVTDHSGTSFQWAFEKRNPDEDVLNSEVRADRVIIYSIYASNTKETGAIGCKNCPLGVQNQQCKPCANGLFYTSVTNETSHITTAACMPCPNGTIAISDAQSTMTVEQACKSCPPGTRPGPDNLCQTDLQPSAPEDRVYNLNALARLMETDGSKLFTSQGHAYMHRYKMFLDTGNMKKQAKCRSDEDKDKIVSSWVCRETAIPDKNDDPINEATFRASPLSLGDTLVKALPTNSSPQYARDMNLLLNKSGWKQDETGNDYHFHFKSKTQIHGCSEGISTIVTLRCGVIGDVTLRGGNMNASDDDVVVQVPPRCTDGTCDGCLYHFMLITLKACPICKYEDYERIEGSCNGGSREIRLIPPKTCRIPQNFKSETSEGCSILTLQGKLAIGLTVSVVILLVLIIIYCHQRNKKLEYKYMKLVEGAEARVKGSMGSGSPSSNDGPGTGCGIMEDESDLQFRQPKSLSNIGAGNPPVVFETRNSGFGPVIFRKRQGYSNVADDSHILTLEDGNTSENI